jgi:hypothetical protein
MEHDLSGKYVLLSKEFFYFGKGAIRLGDFKINIPKRQSGYGVKTEYNIEIIRLWNYLMSKYPLNLPIQMPHTWSKR